MLTEESWSFPLASAGQKDVLFLLGFLVFCFGHISFLPHLNPDFLLILERKTKIIPHCEMMKDLEGDGVFSGQPMSFANEDTLFI